MTAAVDLARVLSGNRLALARAFEDCHLRVHVSADGRLHVRDAGGAPRAKIKALDQLVQFAQPHPPLLAVLKKAGVET